MLNDAKNSDTNASTACDVDTAPPSATHAPRKGHASRNAWMEVQIHGAGVADDNQARVAAGDCTIVGIRDISAAVPRDTPGM